MYRTKPPFVILNVVKNQVAIYTVELLRSSQALVILNAVKNLVLYAGIAPFLWERAA